MIDQRPGADRSGRERHADLRVAGGRRADGRGSGRGASDRRCRIRACRPCTRSYSAGGLDPAGVGSAVGQSRYHDRRRSSGAGSAPASAAARDRVIDQRPAADRARREGRADLRVAGSRRHAGRGCGQCAAIRHDQHIVQMDVVSICAGGQKAEPHVRLAEVGAQVHRDLLPARAAVIARDLAAEIRPGAAVGGYLHLYPVVAVTVARIAIDPVADDGRIVAPGKRKSARPVPPSLIAACGCIGIEFGQIRASMRIDHRVGSSRHNIPGTCRASHLRRRPAAALKAIRDQGRGNAAAGRHGIRCRRPRAVPDGAGGSDITGIGGAVGQPGHRDRRSSAGSGACNAIAARSRVIDQCAGAD